MEKEFPLPTRDLEGTKFTIDVRAGILREKAWPANIMRFADMDDKGTHYDLAYDKVLKNMPNAFSKPSNIVTLQLPPMTQLHPEGMASVYQIRRTNIEQLLDKDIIRNEQLFQDRLAGKMPLLELRKTDYEVDLGQSLLKSKDPKLANIDLRFFEQDDDGGKLRALMNLDGNRIVTLDLANLKTLPPHVVMIRIPSRLHLDPVGSAMEYNMSARSLLPRFPIVPRMQAEIIPLEKTVIAKIVKHNQEQALKAAERHEHQAKQRGKSL